MMKKILVHSTFLKTSLVIAGAAVLAACSTAQPQMPPVSNWGDIQIAESIERLELYARPDGIVLSARDEMAVAGFLQSYGRFGDGPLYINVPNSAYGQGGSQQAHALVSKIMGNMGLSGAPVQTGQYHSGMGQPSPVIVSYRRLKTIPQDCRVLGSMTSTGGNRAYDGFGCSYHANLAAMIEDPRQFLEPYSVTPPDMKRRMQVYDKYIQGENPASEQPDRQEISADTVGG